MSVWTVTRLFDGRHQEEDQKDFNMTVVFRARLNNTNPAFDNNGMFPRDEDALILSIIAWRPAAVNGVAQPVTVRVPDLGAFYESPRRIDGTGGVFDQTLICTKHELLLDQGDPLTYLLVCTFSTNWQNTPSAALPIVCYNTNKYQRVARGAYNSPLFNRVANVNPLNADGTASDNTPIVNAAGEFFVPAPMVDANHPVISIQLWVQGPAGRIPTRYDPAKYQDCMNQNAVFGYAPLTVKVEKITGDWHPFYPQPYWDIRIELLVNRDGWGVNLLNVGFRELYHSTAAGLPAGNNALRPILVNGEAITTPWPLTAQGTAVAPPLTLQALLGINTIYYELNKTVSFADLLTGIPGA